MTEVTLNIPAARVGDYLTGFAAGPRRIVRRYWDDWCWCYELENGAIVENQEVSLDNLLLESEVL